MPNISSFNVTYDKGSDVLYISSRRAPAARGIEDSRGIVWRYDGEGELIGMTVVDFYDRWFMHLPDLADEMSKRFHIPAKQARIVLDHAMDS